MGKPNMDELIARLKAEKAQTEAELAQQVGEQCQRLIEEENQRVKRLEEMIPNWLEAMAANNYPGLELFKVSKRKIIKRLFGDKVEVHNEEVAGWEVGHRDMGGMYSDSTAFISIYLLVDGRLIGLTNSFVDKSPYYLGFDFYIDEVSHGAPSKVISAWLCAEDTIPDNLKKIADEAGVNWNFEPSV